MRSFNEHGFRGPCSWYLNDDANNAYMRQAPNDAQLSMPVLFVNGDLDPINTIVDNRSGEPMQAACKDLTVSHRAGAHWLPLGRKAELDAAIAEWVEAKQL